MVTSQQIKEEIIKTAQREGVDPNFALAIFEHESGLRQYTKSGDILKGPPIKTKRGNIYAYGVAQLLESTAKQYGVKDITDYQQNISGGVKYLKDLFKKHGRNYKSVLKEYGGFVKADPTKYIGDITKRFIKFSLETGIIIRIELTKLDLEYLRKNYKNYRG